MLSQDDVLARLREKQKGSMADLAREMNVSAAYLSDVMAKRRDVGPTILRFLGLERVRVVSVSYQPIPETSR